MYKATITRTNKELSAREKIALKDLGGAVSLFDIVKPDESLIIEVDVVANVHVVNDKSDSGEYSVIVIKDTNGDIYSTGSEGFSTSIGDILDELCESGDTEPFKIKCYKKKSKNEKGYFISCSLMI